MAVAATATNYCAMGAGRTFYKIALRLCRQAKTTSSLHRGSQEHQSHLWAVGLSPSEPVLLLCRVLPLLRRERQYSHI